MYTCRWINKDSDQPRRWSDIPPGILCTICSFAFYKGGQSDGDDEDGDDSVPLGLLARVSRYGYPPGHWRVNPIHHNYRLLKDFIRRAWYHQETDPNTTTDPMVPRVAGMFPPLKRVRWLRNDRFWIPELGPGPQDDIWIQRIALKQGNRHMRKGSDFGRTLYNRLSEAGKVLGEYDPLGMFWNDIKVHDIVMQCYLEYRGARFGYWHTLH